MGIRFYCPNGHKLNVKEFLAGQRGICPRCGERVDIPLKSTRAPGTKDLPIAAEWEERARKEGKLPGMAPFSGSGSVENIFPTLPLESAVQENPLPHLNELFPNQENIGVADIPDWNPQPVPTSEEAVLPNPEPSPAPVVPPTPEVPNVPRLPDPFEGPADTVWYVRPTAGGQYGPVDREIVKVWLSEGRIVGDTLVWREGWADWKRGDEVFEALVPTMNAPPIVATPTQQPDNKKKSFWGFGK
ncbi:MAG: DUF4339 domain-containing protein [Planctomycetia bacterium]|nr:DUF4339 domain-containing protein [Planctomycetia bacterium]